MREDTIRKFIPLDPWKEGRGLLDHEDLVFWVDWRHDDGEIAAECESVLQTGKLSSEWVEEDALFVHFGDRQVQVPLTMSEADRHLTLLAINKAMEGHFEIRFCIASAGSDTVAFLPLPAGSWVKLEQEFGERLARHFYPLQPTPNLFTDPMPFRPMPQAPQGKPWWKFW